MTKKSVISFVLAIAIMLTGISYQTLDVFGEDSTYDTVIDFNVATLNEQLSTAVSYTSNAFDRGAAGISFPSSW